MSQAATHTPGPRPKLTDNQAQVLKGSARRGAWEGGWYWGSVSGTEAIFRALTKKGLAFPLGDERFTPCHYSLTVAGLEEALRIAEDAGEDMADLRASHASLGVVERINYRAAIAEAEDQS